MKGNPRALSYSFTCEAINSPYAGQLVCVDRLIYFPVRSPRFSLRAMALRCEGSLKADFVQYGSNCLSTLV